MNPLDPTTYAELLNRWLAQLPVGYAVGAGMLASVNPCGFLMLPAYASYYVATDDRGTVRDTDGGRLLRATQLGLLATTGFLAVFGPLGAAVSLGGRRLVRLFPHSSLVVGMSLVALGLWLLLSRRRLTLGVSERVRVRRSKSATGVFLFRVAYAVASLGCTLPIFIVVVSGALATGGTMSALLQFVNYALGMGVVLTAVSVGAALAHEAVTMRLRRLLPHVERAGALFLVAAGAYLVYYWYAFGRVLL
jgi:cytochrome c biogenesis protein CcdA